MHVRTRGRALQVMRNRYLREHPLCVVCGQHGKVTPATQLDHVVPIHKGGTDDDANLQGLCHDCHADKTCADTGKQRKPGCDVTGMPISATHPWNH